MRGSLLMDDQPTLDLHGTKHFRVSGDVDRFVSKHLGYEGELKIITGHSERMKEIVTSCLIVYGMEWRDNPDGTASLLVEAL